MVYLMIRPKQRQYKIGCSKNPKERLAAVRRLTPEHECYLYGYIEGDFKLESALHRQFAHLHIYGEWFRSSPKIKKIFKRDIKTLKPYKKYNRKPKIKFWQANINN